MYFIIFCSALDKTYKFKVNVVINIYRHGSQNELHVSENLNLFFLVFISNKNYYEYSAEQYRKKPNNEFPD